MDDAVKAGHQEVRFRLDVYDLQGTRPYIEAAAARGLKLHFGTGYMKYQEAYLAEHPEQRLVFAEEALDSDSSIRLVWGCPFNPDFKQRYFDFLTELALFPGVESIMVNDEADLNSGCYCPHCEAAYAQEVGGEMPGIGQVENELWQDPEWRRFLDWRMDRWAAVHGEMKQTIAAANAGIRVLFIASPASDLCWNNPWRSGVDLARMVEQLDGLATDPYYTFHSRRYDPAEVYLSEWTRFLRGVVPQGKEVAIVPQGFSHPVFTRPLRADDGCWAAVVPAACGADTVFPYTFRLMQCNKPFLAAYQECSSYDSYFERAQPFASVAVVHGAQSEMFRHPLPLATPDSYDGTRMLPCSAALRHHGISYAYLPDRRLDTDALNDYETLILPEINCLDSAQAEAIAAFWRGGGNLVVLGDLATADATGGESAASLLRDLWGIDVRGKLKGQREIVFDESHPLHAKMPSFDRDGAGRYMNGAKQPVFALHQNLIVSAPGARVMACYAGNDPSCPGTPAVVEVNADNGCGRVIYMAGFPSVTATHPLCGTRVINLAHALLPALVKAAARGPAPLRVENWPPPAPMRAARPFDSRNLNTFEFMPLLGDDLLIGVVASYFLEPTEFKMIAALPEGSTLKRVRELRAGKDVDAAVSGGEAVVQVEMGHDNPLKIYVFELGK